MKTYIPRAELLTSLRISASTLDRMVKAEKMPSPVKFGSGRTAVARYCVEDVEAALVALREKYSR
jgi:predicted DNA-binding transcriptional regulator AlpA